MGRNPNKKPFGNGSSNDVNLISQLPESIITHILSCLPTEDALRTSVLAKDWEYRWTSIYNVHLYDRVPFSRKRSHKRSKNADFVEFVERIVLHAKDIKHFSITCVQQKDYDLKRIMAYMSSVLRHSNIESFDYVIFNSKKTTSFPRSLVNCTSLRKLNLVSPCTFKVPAEILFPNLTELDLSSVQILNENHSEAAILLFTFPVLEKLKLVNCKWLNVKMVEFLVPRLIIFAYDATYEAYDYVDYHDYENEDDKEEADQCSIKLVGARLEHFNINGRVYTEILLLSGSTVQSAKILDILGDNQGLYVRNLLRQLSGVENLAIDGCAFEALQKSYRGVPLPRFDKLAKLEVISRMEIGGLLLFLHATPILESLILTMDGDYGWCFDYEYDAVEAVPICITSRLKDIECPNFDGMKAAYDLARFIFAKAEKLQYFGVESYGFKEANHEDYEKEDVEKLLAFPKASTDLSIFIGEKSVYP